MSGHSRKSEMHTTAEHQLSYQLSAGAIDSQNGIIRGATVAQSGVEAIGHFLCLDKNGNITAEPGEAVRKLKIVTDEATLETLMAAAQDAGGVLKIRSDHDDSLGSRAGFADNFQRIENRVTADLHFFDSYKDRAIVLETSAKTPKQIGLSIDMLPSYIIEKDRALMRIDELFAVDVVDEGAITHEGMFLSRVVDKQIKVSSSTHLSTMADDKKTEPTTADCMAAISALAAAFAKFSAPPVVEKKDEELKASVTELRSELAAVKQAQLDMGKVKTALGMKANDVVIGAVDAGEAERVRLAAEKSKESNSQTFLQKVDALFKESAGKMKRSDASRQVMRAEPALYGAHLKALGAVR